LLDRLVGVCLSLLIAAVAVFVAVKLVLSVLVALVAILAVAGFVSLAVAILRSRNRGW
jgi:hypothetical protein